MFAQSHLVNTRAGSNTTGMQPGHRETEWQIRCGLEPGRFGTLLWSTHAYFWFYNRPLPSPVARQLHQQSSSFFFVLKVSLDHWSYPPAVHSIPSSRWLGSVVVRALDLWSRGRRFDSRPAHCRVATLGKLFTPMCLCRCKCSSGTVSNW